MNDISQFLPRRLPAILVGIFILTPVLAALWFGLTAGGGSSWEHIAQNRLLPYTANTVGMLVGVAFLSLIFAIPAAWFISQYQFPGRGLFDWALILPLAMPGYVMAYAWADLAGVAGPLQSSLRALTGLQARDYWFPDLFTLPGLSFVLASTLFPYVYITARAAFSHQSLCILDAAQSLGAGPARVFWNVALPIARPAIAAGLALAMMEAAADYGAADFLGIQTLGVGILRAWYSFGEPATAARLAFVLILIAFTFLAAEKLSRGRAGSQQTAKRWRIPVRKVMDKKAGWLVCALCTLLLLVCFALPLARLIWLLFESGRFSGDIWRPLSASLTLGIAGTCLTISAATVIALTMARGPVAWLPRFASAAGYAAPGAVLGLGGLFILAWLELSLTGMAALLLLVWIYASRFVAAGTEPILAAHARVPKSMHEASASLGTTGLAKTWKVDLPVLRPGLLAALLILFVETLKELPATLMLRPFGWDTLAVRAHSYATDERLSDATLPSLLITLAGLAPVIFLSWQTSASRTETLSR